jgi:hypothetical protein
MIKIKFLARKLFVLKFYFATNISVQSTLLREKEWIRIRFRTVLVTNGSGCESGKLKNIPYRSYGSGTLSSAINDSTLTDKSNVLDPCSLIPDPDPSTLLNPDPIKEFL